MKTNITFFIVLSLVYSCGLPFKKKSGGRLNETTDPAFSEYITTYESKGKEITGQTDFQVNDVPVNFGDVENSQWQGVCNTYEDGSKEIIIRESWWNKVEDKYRESLLFHELGHCHLNRSHLDDTFIVENKEYKKSMMNSIILSPEDLAPLENVYLKELFTENDNELYSTIIELKQQQAGKSSIH